MLRAVHDVLSCPTCQAPFLVPDPDALRCRNGHVYDIARQGYVTLTRSRKSQQTVGDSAEMTSARIRFLLTGRFDEIADRVATIALSAPLDDAAGLTVADLGAGPGYYAGRLMRQAAEHDRRVRIVALDNSLYAIRRAAQVHELVGAARADIWADVPIIDGGLDVALIVFAPRNADELQRVVRPGGRLIVVTPLPGHLKGLRSAVPMLSVAEGKAAELQTNLGEAFRLMHAEQLRSGEMVTAAVAEDVILMGPAARHVTTQEVQAILAREAAWPLDIEVTISVFERA